MTRTYIFRFSIYMIIFILINLITAPYPREYTAFGIDGGLNCDGIISATALNLLLLPVLVFWYMNSITIKTNRAVFIGFIGISICTLGAFSYWYYYSTLCE